MAGYVNETIQSNRWSNWELILRCNRGTLDHPRDVAWLSGPPRVLHLEDTWLALLGYADCALHLKRACDCRASLRQVAEHVGSVASQVRAVVRPRDMCGTVCHAATPNSW